MSFLETVEKARAFLERNGRVSLGALRLEFGLDEAQIEALVEELVEIQQIAVRDGKALAWAGSTPPTGPSEKSRVAEPERAPRDYTPKHPAIDEIRTWLMTQRALPRSSLGKAIAYTSGLWPGLVRFLGDPKIPLDTNGVERALRGVVVGRKNHYGSRSERGTRVAALFYSLIESAKLCGVEPRAYLKEATRRAVRNPGTVTTLARDLKTAEA